MRDIIEQLESLCPRDRRRKDGKLCAVAKNVECSVLMRAARMIREQRATIEARDDEIRRLWEQR